MKLIKSYLLVLLSCFLVGSLASQPTYPYNGVYDQRDGHYAFTNANIVAAPGQTLSDATMVIKDGRITAIGANISPPAGAVVVDLKGKYITPSFLDPYVNYGLPAVKSGGGGGRSTPPQFLSNKEGAYAWNQALQAEFGAHEVFTPDEKAAKEMRNAGFGVVNTYRADGISRGTSTVVSLADKSPNEVILQASAAHHLSFNKGSSTQDYPSSLMGSVALLRQTYLDAIWYKGQNEEVNISLDAWNEAMGLPQIFEVASWQHLLRAQKIADEFKQSYIYKGKGDEYQQLEAIKATGASLIVPLNFPEAYDVADPYAARAVTIAQLRHWERAPGNAAALHKTGIPFAFTTHGLKKPSELLAAVRKAIEHGLSETAALEALTTQAAEMLGLSAKIGTLAKGKWANFLISSKPIFDKKTTIYHNWVQGQPFVIKDLDALEIAGNYELKIGKNTFALTAEGEAGQEKLKIQEKDDKTTEVKHSITGQQLSLRFQPNEAKGFYRLSGAASTDGFSGRGQDPNGEWLDWTMTKTKKKGEKEKEEKTADKDAKSPTYLSQLTFPNIAYGFQEQPKKNEKILIQNATVWTNEADGILEKTDVLIENGKISRIGSNLTDAGARIIDGSGKHLTPGIIDEHSHIALASVNEGAQASSAEVRMEDVVDAVDVDIYRQLAGGVTTSQLLHGSANPIGGQSAIVKLRWGKTADEMIFQEAPGFIKFALGENVKQSNWGDEQVIRYPQTRMGVEQVFENYFTRAREYEAEKTKGGSSFRKDLELEALLEILNNERFISCHSYQQGEINMLMKVAERHNFTVNTFTHILEGYKVADKMAAHGAGGSTFSDWWAYKYEVVEAIPYNASIMHEQGVVVAINSDDAEMARRLNQEAGKMVLFGDVSEEDALKFVTLNPAKLLHIDNKVGSVKVGKDADLVLWSDNPLSIYAIAENTFVDGIEYYSRERDKELRKALHQERNALIQKSLDAKENGEATQPAKGKPKRYLHCDTLDHQENHDGHNHH